MDRDDRFYLIILISYRRKFILILVKLSSIIGLYLNKGKRYVINAKKGLAVGI
ncbi:hypothetical protein TUM4444_06710 [Shewanella sp. MBTL60-112-B1]|nr:hypothetical protein TUM4444_06710 [Shewanella sp. MBTL60-112-B1]